MKKLKLLALKVILTIALTCLSYFYRFNIAPVLYDQGSSSAFDLMIGLWIIIGMLWILLVAYWKDPIK